MRIKYLISLLVLLFLFIGNCYAENYRMDSFKRGDKEFCIMTGYGENHKFITSTKDRFKFITLKARWGVFSSPRNQNYIELAYGEASSDRKNHAFWASFGHRLFFHQDSVDALSFDTSIGLFQIYQRVSELGTKTNFTEQLGVSYQRSISKDSAITIEYKFSHISNAGIKLPNVGINTSIINMGYSWFK